MTTLMQDQVNIFFSYDEKIKNEDLKSVSDLSERRQNHLRVCAEFAFKIGYSGVFLKTPYYNEITENFSLNFLWINLNPQNRESDLAQNIFGDGLDEKENIFNPDFLKKPISKQPIINKIYNWAIKGFKEINLWFDSCLVTKRSLKNTFKEIEEISILTKTQIVMKDIREISLKDYNPFLEESLNPKTPVYYRVDLLKILITIHVINNNKKIYCCFSDVDVLPQNPEKLIDEFTFNFLKKDGYVLAKTREMKKTNLRNFENSFTIFSIKSLEWLNIIISNISQKLINGDWLHSESVFEEIWKSFVEKKEPTDSSCFAYPRKCISTPVSQFAGRAVINKFPLEDHKSEIFRILNIFFQSEESLEFESKLNIDRMNGRSLTQSDTSDLLPSPLLKRIISDGSIIFL